MMVVLLVTMNHVTVLAVCNAAVISMLLGCVDMEHHTCLTPPLF